LLARKSTKEEYYAQDQSVDGYRGLSLSEGSSAREEIVDFQNPLSTATGNDEVIVINHQLIEQEDRTTEQVWTGVSLAIRNVTESTVARILFIANFYDNKGDLLNTVEHTALYLKAKTSRSVFINSSINDIRLVKSYNIRIKETVMADTEKFQIRRNEIRTIETGKEEVRAGIKNISDVESDAVVTATFYNWKKETIGNRAIILRNVEPGKMKYFSFSFTPKEGDILHTYVLNVFSDVQIF